MLEPIESDPRRRACRDLAQGLRRELERRGLSQAQLARAVGTHRDNISGYCAGQSFPRAPLLERIARALDCRVEDLVPSLARPRGAAGAAPQGGLSAALEPDGTTLVRIETRVPVAVAAQVLALLAPHAGAAGAATAVAVDRPWPAPGAAQAADRMPGSRPAAALDAAGSTSRR